MGSTVVRNQRSKYPPLCRICGTKCYCCYANTLVFPHSCCLYCCSVHRHNDRQWSAAWTPHNDHSYDYQNGQSCSSIDSVQRCWCWYSLSLKIMMKRWACWVVCSMCRWLCMLTGRDTLEIRYDIHSYTQHLMSEMLIVINAGIGSWVVWQTWLACWWACSLSFESIVLLDHLLHPTCFQYVVIVSVVQWSDIVLPVFLIVVSFSSSCAYQQLSFWKSRQISVDALIIMNIVDMLHLVNIQLM